MRSAAAAPRWGPGLGGGKRDRRAAGRRERPDPRRRPGAEHGTGRAEGRGGSAAAAAHGARVHRAEMGSA